MKRFTDIKTNSKVYKIYENELRPVRQEDPGDMLTRTEVTKSEPVKFFSKLFESREMAHMFHLKAKGEGSFASHLALQEYYEGGEDDDDNGILDLIDDLVEVYQGQYDLIEGWDNIDKEVNSELEPVQYFIDLAEFIKQTRYKAIIEEDAHLQALIDEVLIMVYKLIYKLRFLK